MPISFKSIRSKSHERNCNPQTHWLSRPGEAAARYRSRFGESAQLKERAIRQSIQYLRKLALKRRRLTLTRLVQKGDVLDELRWEPSLKAEDIGVTVSDGVVTLTGHVPTYSEKHTAENAARRVAGVRGRRRVRGAHAAQARARRRAPSP